jgi:hypothetical protein
MSMLMKGKQKNTVAVVRQHFTKVSKKLRGDETATLRSTLLPVMKWLQVAVSGFSPLLILLVACGPDHEALVWRRDGTLACNVR